MDALRNPKVPEKLRKQAIQDLEVQSTHIGEKSKKIGKVLAERVFYYFMSIDPKIIIH